MDIQKYSLMIKRKGESGYNLHTEPHMHLLPRIGEKLELSIDGPGYVFEVVDVIHNWNAGANPAEIYAIEVDTTTGYLSKLNS